MRPLKALAAWTACVSLCACVSLSNLQYSAEPIEAWIVDEATSKPLEGVIVVAHWQLTRGSLGGGEAPVGTMMVMETMTDANGRFSFPGWGPLTNPTAPEGFLTDRDPVFYVFKSGHGVLELRNKTRDIVYKRDRSLAELRGEIPPERKPSRRKSDWNRMAISLKSLFGTPEQYAKHVAGFSNSLDWNLSWTLECGFKKTPLMAGALDREITLMKARGYREGGFTFDRFLPAAAAKCGLPAKGGR